MYLVSNPHNGKPLSDDNILNYIMSNNDSYQNVKLKESKRLEVKPLLQTNFSDKTDCIFTCLATCVNYYYPKVPSIEDLYKVGIKTYYRITPKDPVEGRLNPFIMRKVYQEMFDYYNIPFFNIRLDLINNIGFNFTRIKKMIDEEIPVILYMHSDGRDFYKDHSVTIIGYTVFEMERKDEEILFEKTKTVNMLTVFDNWSKSIRFVDPTCISMASFIIY